MADLKMMAAPKPIDDLDGWLASFTQPTVAFEVIGAGDQCGVGVGAGGRAAP